MGTWPAMAPFSMQQEGTLLRWTGRRRGRVDFLLGILREWGLAPPPRKQCAMPGTHDSAHQAARQRRLVQRLEPRGSCCGQVTVLLRTDFGRRFWTQSIHRGAALCPRLGWGRYPEKGGEGGREAGEGVGRDFRDVMERLLRRESGGAVGAGGCMAGDAWGRVIASGSAGERGFRRRSGRRGFRWRGGR